MYTRKRRSFKVTPGKLEELWERLVEMRGTPKKGGETLEKRGEPTIFISIEVELERKRGYMPCDMKVRYRHLNIGALK